MTSGFHRHQLWLVALEVGHSHSQELHLKRVNLLNLDIL